MNYLYLLINFLTIIGPLALSFDKKVAFYKNWRYLFPAIGLMACVFIPWDILFTEIEVWGFNPNYISGIHLFSLPLGEALFFLTVPYACVFVYECLNIYFPNRFLIKKPLNFIIILIIFCIVIYVMYNDKLYTGYTALIALLILFIQLLRSSNSRFLGNFYRAFFVCIIPMLLIDGLLTGMPIVEYNALERSAFRLGPIPWEDFLYQFIMIYMVIGFYAYFKRKAKKKAAQIIGLLQ